MTHDPCCTHSMIRHTRHQQVYWFCQSCWQEMPYLEPMAVNAQLETLVQQRGGSHQ